MDGLIGLDTYRVSGQITDLCNYGYSALKQLEDATNVFLTDLRTKWASKNAYEFCQMVNREMEYVLIRLETQITHKVHGANDAARALARANGDSWSDIEFIVEQKGDTGFAQGCFEEINGVSGMAVENVKIIADIFKNNVQKAMVTLNLIPNKISFCSPDGILISTYSTGIEALTNEVYEVTNELLNKIQTFINTETDNILLAKNEAENVLRSNA